MSKEFPDRCLDEYKSVFNKNILKNKYAFVTGGGSGINFVGIYFHFLSIFTI